MVPTSILREYSKDVLDVDSEVDLNAMQSLLEKSMSLFNINSTRQSSPTYLDLKRETSQERREKFNTSLMAPPRDRNFLIICNSTRKGSLPAKRIVKSRKKLLI